jgi:hypothetical protein
MEISVWLLLRATDDDDFWACRFIEHTTGLVRDQGRHVRRLLEVNKSIISILREQLRVQASCPLRTV